MILIFQLNEEKQKLLLFSLFTVTVLLFKLTAFEASHVAVQAGLAQLVRSQLSNQNVSCSIPALPKFEYLCDLLFCLSYHHQLSPISYHPSAITYHPSTMTHQLSTTSYQTSAITHKLSHIRYHPPAIIHQLSPIDYHPSAIKQQLSNNSYHQTDLNTQL